MACNSDEDLPLHLQRPFGAGIRRKPVAFVRASFPEPSTSTDPKDDPAAESVADVYLSVVMGGRYGNEENKSKAIDQDSAVKATPLLCSVCSLPLADVATTTITPMAAVLGPGTCRYPRAG